MVLKIAMSFFETVYYFTVCGLRFTTVINHYSFKVFVVNGKLLCDDDTYFTDEQLSQRKTTNFLKTKNILIVPK